MTVGSWEPNSENKTISEQALREAQEYTSPETFPATPPESIETLQPFMAVPQSGWSDAMKAFNSDQLKSLCRFFTLAEDRWPEWFGGDQNPVIWICKELKTRGDFPDKDLTAWIKQHSRNRFLPYGNVLG